jgi:hypothetical protein
VSWWAQRPASAQLGGSAGGGHRATGGSSGGQERSDARVVRLWPAPTYNCPQPKPSLRTSDIARWLASPVWELPIRVQSLGSQLWCLTGACPQINFIASSCGATMVRTMCRRLWSPWWLCRSHYGRDLHAVCSCRSKYVRRVWVHACVGGLHVFTHVQILQLYPVKRS